MCISGSKIGGGLQIEILRSVTLLNFPNLIPRQPIINTTSKKIKQFDVVVNPPAFLKSLFSPDPGKGAFICWTLGVCEADRPGYLDLMTFGLKICDL